MVRSKHNNLLNYFIFSEPELSKEYVNKCKKFLKEFAAAGPLENDIRKPRYSHKVGRPLGTRLGRGKCPNIPLMCHPHGWPKGNPKYNRNKEQGSSLKYTINGKKPHA
jgi:hypothetical protein